MRELKKRLEEIRSNHIRIRRSFAKKTVLGVAGAAALMTPVAVATAQQNQPASQKPLTFDAASVKLRSVPDGVTVNGNAMTVPKGTGVSVPRNTGGPGTADPGRIHYPLISLKALLSLAFDSYFEVVGPNWLDTQFVQLEATMPPNTTKEQFREMLQGLITDRFKLKYHAGTKEVSGWALVVAKNGPRIKESAEALAPGPEDSSPPTRPPVGPDGFPTRSRVAPGRPGSYMFLGQDGRRRLYGQQQTMHDLARSLEFQLWQDAGPATRRVTVTDATGLASKYDFTLTFVKDGAPDAETFPDIFSAL